MTALWKWPRSKLCIPTNSHVPVLRATSLGRSISVARVDALHVDRCERVIAHVTIIKSGTSCNGEISSFNALASKIYITRITNCGKTDQKSFFRIQTTLRKKNKLTVNFLESFFSKLPCRNESQMGAKTKSKHVSPSKVKTFAVKLLHKS